MKTKYLQSFKLNSFKLLISKRGFTYIELLVALNLLAISILPLIILASPKSGALSLGSTSRYKNISLSLAQKIMDERLSKLQNNFSATDACPSPNAAAPCTRDNLCFNTNASPPCTKDEYEYYRYYLNITNATSSGGVSTTGGGNELFVVYVCVWRSLDTSVNFTNGSYHPNPHTCIASKVARRE